MQFKLCCAFVVILVLTINSDVYSIPLLDILKSGNGSSSVAPLGGIDLETDSAENKTTNGTKKDL